MLRPALRLCVLIAIVATVSSCGGDTTDGELLTRAAFGADWPLTVEEGTVSCEGISEGLGEVYFSAEGTTYAVNGLAQGASDGPDIDLIWADNPEIKGTKINIHPIIERGLELCE